jgi:eukaryotic-like serine/threonine-protein kinase
MPLSPGNRLGRYEILGLLGRGGMGEVYKARDSRLDRVVAVKVLAEAVAGDVDHRARFEREARAISALEHPNICAVYDVGEENGAHYIVMQYLEGQTMAERLTRGSLPLSQVIRHGTEIADALDKAHRAGIVHRDLKPGNVMLTKSGAKLLDFGLAKLHDQPGPLSLSSMTRLGVPNTTAEGTILGTVHYMAPEQVEGRDADSRTDIFALGTVLYEAATGRRPFDGSSPAAIIGSILKDDPSPIVNHAPAIPPALDQLVQGCLAKDPDERWQSTADVRRQLQWIATTQSGSGITAATEPPAKRLRHAGWMAAAALAVALVGVLIFGDGRSGDVASTPVVRFSIAPPAGTTFAADIAQVPSTQLAVSPDGSSVVFVAASPGRRARLWVRQLSATDPRLLAGTEDASYPFWSPDSRSIGYFAQGKLKRTDLDGGSPLELCDVGSDPRGGTWNQAGVILFARDTASGLSQVSASGGAPDAVLDLAPGDNSYRWPSFLPDGRRFLFHIRARNGRSIHLGSLGSRGFRRVLTDAPYSAVYADPGYLLTVRDRTLFAYPFDENALPITGDGLRLADNVGGSTTLRASFSVSPAGVLVYAGPLRTPSRLEWFDRTGKSINTPTDVGDYLNFRLAPEGRRVAVTKVDQKSDTTDVWLLDERNGLERFTDNPGTDTSPVWSHDGTRIMFRSDRAGGNFPFERPADRSAPERQVAQVETVFLTDWASDDERIAFHSSPSGSYDAGVLELTNGAKPRFVAPTKFTEIDGRFSPDRRWFAYSSDSSGRMEVYVAPASGSAGIRASVGGGSEPHWRNDSRELFYMGSDGRITAVAVGPGPALDLGATTPLFQTRALFPGSIFRMNYDVSGDGKRFLVSTPVEGAGTSPITVVMNWAAAFGK